MHSQAVKKCINLSCGFTYEINNDIYRCTCGSLLDIIYSERPWRVLSISFMNEEIMEGTSIMRVVFGVFVT